MTDDNTAKLAICSVGRLFHGGIPRMNVGDIIEPHEPNFIDNCPICEAHKAGIDTAIDPLNHRPEMVFATTDREYGRFYASKFVLGWLYVVEPLGELIPSESDPFPTYMCEQFRVRSIYERAVQLTPAQRRRLFNRWPNEMWKAS